MCISMISSFTNRRVNQCMTNSLNIVVEDNIWNAIEEAPEYKGLASLLWQCYHRHGNTSIWNHMEPIIGTTELSSRNFITNFVCGLLWGVVFFWFLILPLIDVVISHVIWIRGCRKRIIPSERILLLCTTWTSRLLFITPLQCTVLVRHYII